MKKQNIQIFRIISCIGVLIVHIGQHITAVNVRHYTDYGAFGVQLFFMISSVVCYLQFDNKNFELTYRNYLSYIKQRLIRILPLFYYIIFVYFLYYNISGLIPYDNTGLYWWRYIFLIFQFIPSQNDLWMNIGGVWSISAFLIFYFFSPFLWRWIDTLKKSIISLCIFLFIAEILLKNGVYIPKVILFQEFFLLGIIIYLAIKEQKENQFIVINCIVLLLIGVKRDHLPVSLCYRNYEIIIFSMICAILIAVTWNYKIEKEIIIRIIDKFDEYTYPVYLCHPFIITILLRYYKEIDTGLKTLMFIGITIVGTLIFSFVSKYITDKVLCILKLNVGVK